MDRRFSFRGVFAAATVLLFVPLAAIAQSERIPRLEVAAGLGCPGPLGEWNTVTNPGIAGDFIAGFHLLPRLQVGAEAMLGYPTASGLINMPDGMDIDWRIQRFGGYARWFFVTGDPSGIDPKEKFRYFLVADAGQYRLKAKVIINGETLVDESESAIGFGGGIGFQAYHAYDSMVRELRAGLSLTIHYMPVDDPEAFGLDAGTSSIMFAEVTLNIGVALF